MCCVGGTWLAQLEEHVTPDLGVVSWSPSLGVEITWGRGRGGKNVLLEMKLGVKTCVFLVFEPSTSPVPIGILCSS